MFSFVFRHSTNIDIYLSKATERIPASPSEGAEPAVSVSNVKEEKSAKNSQAVEPSSEGSQTPPFVQRRSNTGRGGKLDAVLQKLTSNSANPNQ